MIKVLHSELQSNIGGIETFLLNLTKTINKSNTNIQFDFLMRGSNPYLETTLKKYGANIYKVPSGMINYYKFVKHILIKNNYNFVHVHKNSAANIVLPLMVKKYTNAKLIVHSHNTSPSGGSKLAIILHKINRKKLLKLSDYKLACSDTAAQWMFGKRYNQENVRIIKNGIILEDYLFNSNVRKRVRTNLGLTDKFVIGHVGAFRKQKNHEFLLEMFSRLNIPNSVLLLVGDGPLIESIKQKAIDLGISNQIIFLGSRNDVADLLQAMDVFVMPSLWEGLSIATIEAQASGLPLVLSDKVSRLTKVTNNVSFVKLSNIDNWIEKIIYYKDNFIRRNQLLSIQNAGYDMQKSAIKLRRIYAKIN